MKALVSQGNVAINSYERMSKLLRSMFQICARPHIMRERIYAMNEHTHHLLSYTLVIGATGTSEEYGASVVTAVSPSVSMAPSGSRPASTAGSKPIPHEIYTSQSMASSPYGKLTGGIATLGSPKDRAGKVCNVGIILRKDSGL